MIDVDKNETPLVFKQVYPGKFKPNWDAVFWKVLIESYRACYLKPTREKISNLRVNSLEFRHETIFKVIDRKMLSE